MKMTKNYFIGLIVGMLISVIVQYIVEYRKEPRLAIDCEYYLEVSEDSIWIESQEGLVYTGKYADLDSLISVDNK